jgi:heat shock protein HslJ
MEMTYNLKHMKRILALFAIMALAGAGCTMPWSSKTDTNVVTPTGIQGKWKMVTMKQGSAAAKNVADLALTVTFDGGKMSGNVCNSMSGDYTLDANNVLLAPAIVSTKMFCAGPMGEAESAFTSGMSAGFKTSFDDGLMMLNSDEFVLVFERVSP